MYPHTHTKNEKHSAQNVNDLHTTHTLSLSHTHARTCTHVYPHITPANERHSAQRANCIHTTYTHALTHPHKHARTRTRMYPHIHTRKREASSIERQWHLLPVVLQRVSRSHFDVTFHKHRSLLTLHTNITRSWRRASGAFAEKGVFYLGLFQHI